MNGNRTSRSARRAPKAALVGALFLLLPALSSAGPRQAVAPALTSSVQVIRQAPEQVRQFRVETPRSRMRKLDPLLLRALGGRSSRFGVSVGMPVLEDGRLRVIVEANDPAAARERVASLGGRVERGWHGLVQASIPARALGALAGARSVDYVRAPAQSIEYAVSGEEVASSLAQAWHAKGLTGKGVKIAIVDGGFAGLAERQAEGDLPATAVTKDICDGQFATATDHGTAVAEIVHEMAPDAQLYLVCVDTEIDVAAAEAFAKAAGVRVINHSMGWEGPWRDDGRGLVSTLVADARANGIVWVNAAGNEANTHWSGTFSGNGDSIHDFAPGDEGNSFVWESGERICGFLKWDEWPAAVSDFDLGLFLSGPNVLLAASEESQGSGGPPFEAVCARQTSGADLQVFWGIRGYRVSSQPRLDLFSWSGPLEYATPAGSIAEPAASPAAFAVGALCWQSRELEPYSSQGPTIDGRTKPDLAGHDSVSGETYGPFEGCPSAFAGTSAAAPEVAGAAALVRQAYPSWRPAEIEAFLKKNARDLGSPGPDSLTGAGELHLPDAPDVAPPTARALASSGRAGAGVKLRSTVSDDSGQVAVVEQVKKNRRVVATIARRDFVRAAGATTVVVVWKAPASAQGSYRHCVRAQDRGGNASAWSCASVAVRAAR